jgi:uncharacterized protein
MQFIPVIERVADASTEGEASPSPSVEGEVPWASWRDRPLYTQTGDEVTARSVSSGGYGRFVIEVFEEWVRHDIGEVYVQMFDAALANWAGEQPGLCVHCETCGLALALEHNGDDYSCDHFVEPRYLLGNISEPQLSDLVSSKRQQKFGLDKRDKLPRYCRECDVRFACHGGCPKDRFVETPDGEPGLNYLCPSFKRFFHHVEEPMRLMTLLLTQGRAPAELARLYAARDARRARNEPCPCASGRKWKHCHGDTPQVPGAAFSPGSDDASREAGR